jgi:hypothetical protein
MMFPPIWELMIVAMADGGVPNKERIIIRPTEKIDLGEFCVCAGLRHKDNPNVVIPLLDNIFWFSNLTIEPPSWIFIYTGKGEFRETTANGTNERALVFHWGREETIFNFLDIVPVIFRQAGILIGPSPDRPPLPPIPGLIQPSVPNLKALPALRR